MPRSPIRPRDRRPAPLPDFRYGSPLVSRLVNKLNYEGKKSTAEKIIYGAFDIIKEKTKLDPLDVFNTAIENVKPLVEVKARRVGGATYQVPVAVRPDRSVALAMRWILRYAGEKTGRPMKMRLADELIAASKKEGSAIKKREDTHRMAEANKAFAHYRW